jgi:hypothetical protein
VCLEGHPDDVADQAALAGLGAVDGPPPLPAGAVSAVVSPTTLASLDQAAHGPFVAELGVGLVHCTQPLAPAARPDAAAVALTTRIKRAFDPAGRLNPGRAPAGVDQVAAGVGP